MWHGSCDGECFWWVRSCVRVTLESKPFRRLTSGALVLRNFWPQANTNFFSLLISQMRPWSEIRLPNCSWLEMRDTQQTALYFAYARYRVKERKGKSVLAASVPRHMTKECQICLWLWRKPLISVNQFTPVQLQTPLQRRVRRNGKPSKSNLKYAVFKELFTGGARSMDLLHLNSSPAVEALQVHFLQFCVWHREIHIILCLCSLTRLIPHCTYLSCSLHRPSSQLVPKLMAETDRVLLHYLHSFFH